MKTLSVLAGTLVWCICSNAQTFDVFPLQVGLGYKYNYWRSSSYSFIMTIESSSDSGLVEYAIQSVTTSDSILSWNIQERSNLKMHRLDRNRNIDTTYWRSDSAFIVLKEYRQGNHELRCSSLVWSFPLTNPSQGIFRYGDSSTILIARDLTAPPPPFPTIGADSLWFNSDMGFLRRFRWTSGGGISRWSTTFLAKLIQPPTLSVERYEQQDHSFDLLRNYPNPFNSATTIKYEIPIDTHVSLRICNALGQEVAVLVNENQFAGYRSVEFNASNLASGVYFYRLQAGDFVQTKKLILLR